jgi:hypothetical protein
MPNRLYYPVQGTLTPGLTILTGRFRLSALFDSDTGSYKFDPQDSVGMKMAPEFNVIPFADRDEYEIELDQNYSELVGCSMTGGYRNDEDLAADKTLSLIVIDRSQIGDATIEKPVITLCPYDVANTGTSGVPATMTIADAKYHQLYITLLLRNSELKYG